LLPALFRASKNVQLLRKLKTAAATQAAKNLRTRVWTTQPRFSDLYGFKLRPTKFLYRHGVPMTNHNPWCCHVIPANSSHVSGWCCYYSRTEWQSISI
jgi:hypothetical protein